MAAEGLFYEEGAFKLIVYCGVAILGVLVIVGFLYEYLAKKYLHRKSVTFISCCNKPRSFSILVFYPKRSREVKLSHDIWPFSIIVPCALLKIAQNGGKFKILNIVLYLLIQ